MISPMAGPATGTATSILGGFTAPGPEVQPLPHRAPRANLMPPEVLGRRRLERLQKLLAVGLAAVVALAATAWVLTARSVQSAEQDVAAAQARTAELTAEQARYAEVPRVLGQIEAHEVALERALAGDVVWVDLLAEVDRRAPEGVWLTDLSISLAPEASSGAPAAATDPLADPAVAVLAFEGTGDDHNDVAAWLNALTEVPGFSDARYSTSTRADIDGTPVTQFSSTVGVTTDALSHRFDRKGA